MNEMTWAPSLLVLAVGLAAGVWLALRFRQQAAGKQAEAADLPLEIRDLEDRRDDLYRRLRAADEDNLSDSERDSLVDAAARTLMELDHLQTRLPAVTSVETATGGESERDEADERDEALLAPGDGPHQGRSMATGVLIGAAMVGIVALLVYFAVRDATPTAQQPMVQAAPGASEDPHSGQMSALPPELAAQVADLQTRIVNDPEDWIAKKQLSLILLSSGQFFEAFTLAGEVLQRFPEDPDALLVHGIVRVSMGQFEAGKDLLDRVLAERPDHRQALLYRGLALYQLGQVEQAVDTWQIGLEMAGGSDPDFEELLAMAEAGVTIGEAAPQAPSTATSAPTESSAAIADGSYGIRLELAAGVAPTAGSTLFVFLREEKGGAPVAVTRVAAPTFPLQISLSAADSMIGGGELPGSGVLVARLDGDGSVTTTEPRDLQAEAAAIAGEATTLVLGR